MKPEIHARLTISGEFDPAEATRRLGVEPHYSWRKGEPRSPRTPHLLTKTDLWSSPWSKGKPIVGESYVENLLDEFWPKREILRGLVDEFGVALEVSVAIYIYDDDDVFETPSMHLDAAVLRRIADLGAEIDLDLYVMDSPDPEEERHEYDR